MALVFAAAFHGLARTQSKEAFDACSLADSEIVKTPVMKADPGVEETPSVGIM